MRRVSVVGISGAGKTTLARRLAGRLGVAYVELDAIHHLAGWRPIDPELFRSRLEEITSADGWVVDGNYRAVVTDAGGAGRGSTAAAGDPQIATPRRRARRALASSGP